MNNLKKITRRYLSEPEYRARISLYAGLLINSAYIVFKAGLGIYYRSAWYGAVAVYHIVLSAIRFFLVQSDRKTLTEGQALRRYRLTGLSMLFLNMAMAGSMGRLVPTDFCGSDGSFGGYPGSGRFPDIVFKEKSKEGIIHT